MNKKIKSILLAGIILALLIIGVGRLNIQSVKEYEKEGQEISKQIMPEETTHVESSKSAISANIETTREPDSKKEKIPSRKKKPSNQKPAQTERSPKNAPKQTTVPKATAKVGKKIKSTPRPTEKHSDIIQCSIEIRCDSILSNKDKIAADKLEYVPENGVILEKRNITVKKGTNAYQVLADVCQAEGIALDSEYTPMYGSYYVRGIAHLYEMDAGDNSGWLYSVNGKRPEVGASSFLLSEGDAILWRYTCNELD